MPVQITMPRLSDTMEEGTLIKWRVKVGDAVKSGDILADVETDKATMELQAFDDGTVAELAIEEGKSAPVGALILVLSTSDESPAPGTPETSAPETPENSPKTSDSSSAATAEESPEAEEQVLAAGQRIRVSPLARKIAAQQGIDLAQIKGTGPGGRIIKRDLSTPGTTSETAPGSGDVSSPLPRAGEAGRGQQAKPLPPAQATRSQAPIKPITPQQSPASDSTAPKLEAKTIPLTNMRKTIARRLAESKSTIPHFTVTVSVDMEYLLGQRGAKKQLETQGIKVSVNDFIVRAAALSLLQHPAVNSSFAGDQIIQHGTVNLGVAVALPPEKGGGLVVPTLRDAQNMSLRTISSQTRQLAEKARTTGLSLEEMSDGTFTLSNLGMFGVDHFEAIINPPQAAILAVGAALDVPIVRDGQIVPGKIMTITLSADHRVVDGAMAAAYLQTVKQMLENPAVLLV